jgi:hypothetical protein
MLGGVRWYSEFSMPQWIPIGGEKSRSSLDSKCLLLVHEIFEAFSVLKCLIL